MESQKDHLIREIIDYGYLKSERVIAAFRKVSRENFVEREYTKQAYVNEPLPIRKGQTISQPLTVVAMTEALLPRDGDKILDVGAGSGYQAAILAEIVGPRGRIITIERIHKLVEFARSNLQKSGYTNVEVVHADGKNGYPEEAPYDRIIVAASADEIPEALISQLKPNGRLVIPVEDRLVLVEKSDKIKKTVLGHYVFVPLLDGKR